MSLIAPELVNIAGFNLLKLGSLKRREQKWFVDRDKNIMRGLVEILKIAQDLSLQNEIDPTAAYQIVSSYGTSDGSDLLVPYASKLAELTDLLGTQESTPADAVTMMLQSRLESSWLAQNQGRLRDCYGIIVEGEGWKDSYTQELPEATIDELWEFIQNERNRWQNANNEVPDSVEGKSAPTPNISIETTTNTGTTAIGRSNSAPSPIPLSMPEPLVNAPVLA